MSQKHPTWTRARVGRNRVHWVAYDARPESEGRQVVDQGYAASLPEADAAARAALASAGMYQARRLSTGFGPARRADQPRPKPSPRPERARPVEYVYTRQDEDLGPIVAAHLVVKKTAKKVYVTQRSCGLNQLGTDDERWEPGERTIPLDRLGLERDGSVYSKGHRHSDFFTSRDAAAGDSSGPDPLKALGIRAPCTVEEIKSAYRARAMAVHPDRGGSPEDFRAVEAAYRRLMREAQVSET